MQSLAFTSGIPMNKALHILSGSPAEVLIDLVTAGKTSEMARRIVPKTAVKGDSFLLFDHDSLIFAACGEIASDAARDPNEDPKYYFSALKFYTFFDSDNGISRRQVIEAHPTWATDFPEWKWIQQPSQGRRPGYAYNAKVPDAIGEELWGFVLDAVFGNSEWRNRPPVLWDVERPEDDTQPFYYEVSQSLQDSHSSRQARLATAPKIPDRITTTSTSFRRNPDVVAEVLLRANGKCESCLQPAPFARASDGTPYLEVHHRTMLAAGGEDTVANAIALCPNCHRAAHYA